MSRARNIFRIALCIILFPVFLHQLGRYVEDIHDTDMYYGGKG